jgi:GNAT superfamily N-acetyltransferase
MHTNLTRLDNRDNRAWAIRPMGRDDLPALKRLFRKLHLYNASLDPRFALADGWEKHVDALFDGPLPAPRRLALLASVQGRPAGFLLAAVHQDSPLWRHRDWVEVEALYVERAWWGTGMADALLSRAFDWTALLGLVAVQLYVTVTNTRALRFYQRQGFVPAQTIMRALLAAN